jgi:hypothetical protein
LLEEVKVHVDPASKQFSRESLFFPEHFELKILKISSRHIQALPIFFNQLVIHLYILMAEHSLDLSIRDIDQQFEPDPGPHRPHLLITDHEIIRYHHEIAALEGVEDWPEVDRDGAEGLPGCLFAGELLVLEGHVEVG